MSINIGDAILKFLADTSDLDDVSRAQASIAASSAKLAQAANQGAAGIDHMARSADKASASLQKEKDQVEQLAKSLGVTTAASIRQEWARAAELVYAMKRVASPVADLEAAEAREKEIFARLQQHLRGVQDSAGATQTKLGDMFMSMFGGQMAFDLVMRGLRGVKQLLSDSMQEALAFERAFRDVDVALAGSGVGSDKYRQALQGVSTELGRASDLAKGLAVALRSTDKDPNAVELVTSSARLAQTYGLDLKSTVASVSDILATYNVGAERSAEYTNMLGVAFAKSDDFGQAFLERDGKFLPILQALDVPFNDLLAIITALTQKGLSATEALAGVGQILLAATKPTKEMSDALYAVQAAGHQVNVTLGRDGVRAAGGLLPWLERLAAAVQGSDDAMAAFGGGIRRASAVFALFGQDISQVEKLSAQYADKVGTARTATEQFTAKMQDLETQAKRTWVVWTEGIAELIGGTRWLAQAWREVNNLMELSFKLLRLGLDLPGYLAAAAIQAYSLPKPPPAVSFPAPKKPGGSTTGPVYSGPSVDQVQYAAEITAQLDKQAGITAKYARLEAEVNEKLAGQEELRNRILGLVRKRRQEEIEDSGRQVKEQRRRMLEQQAEEAKAARASLMGRIGLSDARSLDQLKGAEEAARAFYQLRVNSAAPVYEQVQAYDAWRRKLLELNDALRRNYEVVREFPALVNKNFETQQSRLEEIIRSNRSGGKVQMEVAPIKGLSGFLEGSEKVDLQMQLLRRSFEALGLQSKADAEKMIGTARDWLRSIEWAFDQGLATNEQVLAAERAFLEARVKAWQDGNAAITQAELDRLAAIKKQQQEGEKKPYQFDQNSPMSSLLRAWKEKKGEVDKELTASEKIFAEFGDAMSGAIGAGLASWISGTGSFADAMKSMLAQLAQYWMVRSIGELAEGFAMLFINPADAALHFKAAALFGAAATAAGLASRAIPSANQQGTETAGADQEYKRKSPEPVKGIMGGQSTGTTAYASDLAAYQEAINTRLGNMAYASRAVSLQSNGMAAGAPVSITINAVDAASFHDLCKRNPQAVISVVEGDILNNGRIRRATASRTPA